MRSLSSLLSLSCCAAAVLTGCKASPRSAGTAVDTAASAASSAVSAAANTTMATAKSAADTTMAAAKTAVAGTISLADVAGRWNIRSVPDSGKDTSATTYVLSAKADSTGWVTIYPNRKPVPTRVVAVAGDSIVTESAPFESVRRKNVQVRTHAVLRREGDRLVGHTVAHYTTKGPDSVQTFRTQGTREAGAAR